VQFCTLDFLKQHGGDDRVLVFRRECKISNEIGFFRRKVNWWARPTRSFCNHDRLLSLDGRASAACGDPLQRPLPALLRNLVHLPLDGSRTGKQAPVHFIKSVVRREEHEATRDADGDPHGAAIKLDAKTLRIHDFPPDKHDVARTVRSVAIQATGQQGRSVRPGMVIAGGSLAGNVSSRASSRLASRQSTYEAGTSRSRFIDFTCSVPAEATGLKGGGVARPPKWSAERRSGALRT
jgi:hypothetical protein